MYNRGTVSSYEKWANLTGDDSYRFPEFLQYFTKSTNYTGPGPLRNPNASVPTPEPQAMDPNGSPLHVSYPNFALPISSWMQKTFSAFGIPSVRSLLSGNLIGHQYIPFMIDPTSATRDSSETSFLQSSIRASHSNLITYTNTLAERVHFNNTRAVGVQVSQHPSAPSFFLTARHEVILSAGAVQSPHLLQVSGIGPRALLENHNITVLVDSPGVGQNLWEHFNIAFSRQTNIAEGINPALYNASYAAEAAQEYYERQSGPFSNANTDYTAWTKLPDKYRGALGATARKQLDSNFPADWPELEIEVSAGSLTPTNANNLLLVAVLVAPLSRGSVSLTSRSIRDQAALDLGLLSSPVDQKMLVQTIKFLRDLVGQPILQSVLVGPEQAPGANVTSDVQILQYYQQNPAFNWHAACTCAMGRDDNSMAVLDSRARVKGVQGLRVVDASSFPLLPPGHPVATICKFIFYDCLKACRVLLSLDANLKVDALAEKIAEDIISETSSL